MAANFIKPNYDTGGFAHLPGKIIDSLSTNKYDAIVLFLIDGFGWRSFEKFQQEPFLQKVARLGTVRKLTSQFPSTTSAHITTIHTGMPVGEHGIFEWYYYEPLLDAVIAPLLHSFSGTTQRDTLKPTGVKASQLYPLRSMYRSFREKGLSGRIFQHREYTPSTYSNILFKGAKVTGYRTLPEGLINLAESISESKPPAYFFCYFDRIDSISHEYGPESAQVNAEIRLFLIAMETIFLKTMAANRRKILFLMTADHGQTETDPQTTVYLNRDPTLAGIEKLLKTNRAGEPLAPAGSARDFFLYIKDGLVEEAQGFLAERLSGRAEVRKVAEMAAQGYFGPLISERFRLHAGELVILPYQGESVWWYEKDRFEQRFYGHHGGLTREEMEIPLIMWEM